MAQWHRCVDEDGATWLAPIDAGEPDVAAIILAEADCGYGGYHVGRWPGFYTNKQWLRGGSFHSDIDRTRWKSSQI